MDHLKELFLKENGSFKSSTLMKCGFKMGRQKGTSVIMYGTSLMHFSSLFYPSILSYAYMFGFTCKDLQRY